MRGTGSEGQYLFVYEAALAELCGSLPVAARNLTGVDAPANAPREWYHMRACMVADVSATNGLCFFAMLKRIGMPNHKARRRCTAARRLAAGARGRH
jgi:hypothetical protein